MTVWLVIFHDVESDEVLGVFATAALAEAAITQHGQYAQHPQGVERSKAVEWHHADIQAWPVTGATADG